MTPADCTVQLIEAYGAEHVPVVRRLFIEYAQSLGFSLCFQGFDREVAELPGAYAPPAGRLFLARRQLAGPAPTEAPASSPVARAGSHPAARPGPSEVAHSGDFIGCIALRKIGEGVCEMKRLYVRPQARGHGVGQFLVERLLREARAIGYAKILLDTLDRMQTAIAIYRSFGFKECAPYSYHPVPGSRCFELPLDGHP
ncbi:MAG: GNAT family N-acetyltransferase [Planctomycetota bacterium]